MCDNGKLYRADTGASNFYQLLDTSAAVTVAQGGTGATTAANARTNLGLGSAATCAATAFLAASGCAADSAKLGGTAKSGLFTAMSYASNQVSITVGGTTKCVTLGSAAACAASAFRACTWTPACVACAGQVMIGGAAATLGTAAKCASTAFLGATATACYATAADRAATATCAVCASYIHVLTATQAKGSCVPNHDFFCYVGRGNCRVSSKGDMPTTGITYIRQKQICS